MTLEDVQQIFFIKMETNQSKGWRFTANILDLVWIGIAVLRIIYKYASYENHMILSDLCIFGDWGRACEKGKYSSIN